MTDPKDQERNDFRPMEYRGDPGELQPDVEPEGPEDEARNRGDFSDPRVQQPGDEPAEETGLPSPDSE